LWTQSPSAIAQWVVLPNPENVEAYAQSSEDGVASLIAETGSLDLSNDSEIWFDGIVAMGTPFRVTISTNEGGWCQWNLIGRGQARYSVDLTSASDCGPTACGLSRAAVSSVGFGTFQWGTNYTLDITLTGLGFTPATATISPTTTAAGSGVGVNDWCWSLFFWSANGSGATSTWVTAPSAQDCHFSVTDTFDEAGAGAVVELPASLKDLSSKTTLLLDATISQTTATAFVVQLNDTHEAYALWEVTTQPGSHQYVIDLAAPDYLGQGSGYEYDNTAVRTLTVMSDGEQTGKSDFDITAIQFL
jgi:hypothetical protein